MGGFQAHVYKTITKKEKLQHCEWAFWGKGVILGEILSTAPKTHGYNF